MDSVSKEDLNLLFYVVKIIFFYVLEEILFVYWEKNKGICLLYMLDMLLFCFYKKYMLDYFIIIWNLLEDVIEDECKVFYLRLLVI